MKAPWARVLAKIFRRRAVQNVTKKEADHKFGIFDLAATVDYDSFHGV